MTQLFRQEAIDNKKEKLWGEVILIQPFSFFVITAFVTIVVIAVALMLLYGTYARRENVSGYLLPNKGLVKIYAPQVGTVTNVHVEESTLVNQGDLLLTISTQKTNFKSDDVNTLIINKLKDDKTTIRSKLTEQNRLDDLEKSQYKDQVSGLNREIKQLKNQVKTHKKNLGYHKSNLVDWMNCMLKNIYQNLTILPLKNITLIFNSALMKFANN